MMPTFPRSPLSFRTASFPSTAGRLAFQAVPSWVIGGLSLLPAFAVRHPVCIRPSCFNVDPPRVGSVDAITAPPCGEIAMCPRVGRMGPIK